MEPSNFLFLVGGIYAVYYTCAIVYELSLGNKTTDRSKPVMADNFLEEQPFLVSEDYVYEQSDLTKKEFDLRMTLYDESRKKWEDRDSIDEIKKEPKKKVSPDDDLGMSF